MEEQADLIQTMLRPETYPAGETPLEHVETHVSHLFFTSAHVYKIKKAVDFGFLNFTTLERRRFFCEEEVRLNHRFAPDTYLGVVDIRRTPDGVRIGKQGEIIEHAVLMRRLPAERMLDHLIAVGDPALPTAMEALAGQLARLHAASEVCRRNGNLPNVEVVRGNWQENFEQLAPFAEHTLDHRAIALIAAYVASFLKEHTFLFGRREAEGWVRDGHGDLHAEHVCLTEPIRIYDCIEFNRRFRVGDTAADLAFLLMDLEYRGRRDLAERLLNTYRHEGGNGQGLSTLLPFYKLYRAVVRGKVNSFLAVDPAADTQIRRQAAMEARRYFNLGLGYLCPPVMVLTSGLMGSGKSTLAAALASCLGAEVLRSDRIRKELAGDLASEGRTAPFGEGIYSPDFHRQTYDELLSRARAALHSGRSVVVDASFLLHRDRDRFREAARAAGMPALLVMTECDRQTSLARLNARFAAGRDLSDGRPELYDAQAALFEPPAPAENAVTVDSTGAVDYNVHLLLIEIIERAG